MNTNFIKQLMLLSFFLLGINGIVFAKLPVERVEKDNAKVLFSQDAESEDVEADTEDKDDDADSEKASNQTEMFEDVISQAKNYHDNLLKNSKSLSPKQNLLRSIAEDNAEQAVINRNHVDVPDPLLEEGRYLYNQDVARERGKIIMKESGRDKKASEKSLASSFNSISHNKPIKKIDNKESSTVAEYKLKAKKLSELKNNKKKDKKEDDRDVTYKNQAEALSESFR